MKKLVIVSIILCLIFSFVGCTNSAIDIFTEPTTPIIQNDKEFPEIEWPTFGAATKIPIPTWSNYGEILVDSETEFWCQIRYSTLDDYENYVSACQEAGYIDDQYNDNGYMYYGSNDDNYGVQLTYNKYDHYIAIQVTNDSYNWDKWWEEE